MAITIDHEPQSLEFSIAKLEVKPGDTVLFKVKNLDRALANVPHRVAAFEEHIRTFMPEGVKAMLIDHDMDVSILSNRVDHRRGR